MSDQYGLVPVTHRRTSSELVVVSSVALRPRNILPGLGNDVIDIGNQSLRESMGLAQKSYITSMDVLGRGMSLSSAGAKELAKGSYKMVRNVSSETLKQMNRYTPDIYDIGGYGKNDLSRDTLMSIMGHSAMLTQNGVRVARVPLRYTLEGVRKIVYNPERIRKAEIRKELYKKTDPYVSKRYIEIATGHSHKDAIQYRDRLAWNRYAPNEMRNWTLEDRGKLMFNKMRAQKVDRLRGRNELIKGMNKNLKENQFSVKKSLKGTASNQTRKALNKLTSGDGFDQKTLRSALRVGQGVKSAWPMLKRAAVYVRYIAVHPIQTTKKLFDAIFKFFKAIKGLIYTIPVVFSTILLCLPAITFVFILMSVIVPGANLEIQNRYNAGNLAKIATPEYAANAFIYEAKERGWKDNAIIGTLAYILAEGSGMGTFTYEGYHAGFTGPEGKEKEKTLDNAAWKSWLKGSGKSQGQAAGLITIGLGLLQDSDSLSATGGAGHATNLIKYAEGEDQPWQDPKTQLKWVLDERIGNWRKYQNLPPFDTADVDPTKTNLTAEEWCGRITCGIGMPGWFYEDYKENKYVQAHIAKVSEAREYVNNYTVFDYISIHGGTIHGDPDFSNVNAWIKENPYADSYTGQCTWFAWGRFYEIYGYSPGFIGTGSQCVSQLLATHPDKFKFSKTPVAGSVFSCTSVLVDGSDVTGGAGHVGIITAVGPDSITIQEGNLNGKTDPFEIAITDWHTKTYSMSVFNSIHQNTTYAVPI